MKTMKKLLCLLVALCFVFASAEEMLRLGASGDDVKALQNRLAELGYTTTETDGVFGEGTERALKQFQSENDLLVTGMADAVTLRVLFSEEAVTYDETRYFVFDEESETVGVIDSLMSAVFPSLSISKSVNGTGFVAEDTGAFNGMPMPFPFDTREYTTFTENGFLSVASSPLSTFAADVDTASWTQIRALLLNGEEVPADAVRVEEMLNYFRYSYNQPRGGEPFGVTMELGDCPWNEKTKLLLVGLQAEEIADDGVPSNLVFLIDVSGSMDEPDKLPLVKRAFMLLLDELKPTDTVSVVVYASREEVLLDGVPAANKTQILETINNLTAGGGTNGSAGITTAYEIAEKHFIEGGVNRILLATDGDLNIGTTSEGDLARLVSDKKDGGVSLTALGFGGWNYKDNRMEALADYGDGNYYFIDTIHEARRALVTEAGGSFRTVAKDVKLQLDFNPALVKGYRLIGYEDRLLAAEDFADDSVDGGEIGSGHRVTALYEIVPADSDFDFGEVVSKYASGGDGGSGEWLTLSVRAKEPDGDESRLFTYVLDDESAFEPTENLRFAAAVAEIGMLLRGSEYSGTATYDTALDLLRSCPSVTGDVYKEELVYLAGLLAR